MKPRDKPQADCYLLMSLAGFKYERRRIWTIWAAKHQVCSRCGAEPWTPCINLNMRYNRHVEVATRMPHKERIDWVRFLDGLKRRGIGNVG